MTPLVSILVPVYKVPIEYLKRCLDSLIKQSLENIEIILVDDGSPDECGKVCDGYANLDSRILVIHQHNKGLSAARNAAFWAATGKYILFVDGDDYLSASACEILLNAVENENVQMVFCNYISQYANSHIENIYAVDKQITFKGNDCKKLQVDIFDFNKKFSQVFTKLIDREFLLHHKIIHNDTLKQGAEGLVFNMMLTENLSSAIYINQNLYYYSYNENSITHVFNEENNYLILKCFSYMLEYAEICQNKDELKIGIYTRVLYVIITMAISSYFNPSNNMSYSERVRRYKLFLNNSLVKDSLKYGNIKSLSIQRKFIIHMIKQNVFILFLILGKLRRKQLKRK